MPPGYDRYRRIALAVLAVCLWAGTASAQVFGDFTGEPGSTPGTGITVTNPGLGMPVLSLEDTAVTLGTYGNATNVGQFTVDKQGRLTFAQNVVITGSVDAVTSIDTLFWLAGWQ